MRTLAKLVIAIGLSWYVADQTGMTPLDGIDAMRAVSEQLVLP